MKKYLICVILSVVAIILELLPFGTVLNFGIPATDGSVGFFRETYSYFDLMPFGYGHFGCLITAILTCVLLIVSIIYFIKKTERVRNIISVLSFIASIISLSPFMLGISFVSVVGILISMTLIAEFIISKFVLVKKCEKDAEK